MPRYIKQRDNFRCGPVAIANAIKWAGGDFSFRKNKKWLDEVANTTAPTGTWPVHFHRALRKVGGEHFTITKRRLEKLTPTQSIRLIRKHLKSGGAVIMNVSRYTQMGDDAGHYFLLIGYGDGFFLGVNMSTDKTVEYIHTRRLRDDLRGGGWPHGCWLLRRKDDRPY